MSHCPACADPLCQGSDDSEEVKQLRADLDEAVRLIKQTVRVAKDLRYNAISTFDVVTKLDEADTFLAKRKARKS